MQRRGGSGQQVKDRPKVHKVPTTHVSTDHSAEKFDRLERERNEALEQLAATTEILRVIRASPTDAQPVFETIVCNAVSLSGGLFANVFSFDGELLHYVASHNVGPSYADMIRANYPRRPDPSQVAGRVLLTKSVVRLEDALIDPDYDQRFPRAMGWRRLLGVPMVRGGEPIGVIVVGWAEAGPVPKVQEELLKTFADQAVIAIENVRLFNETKEALERQTATAEILQTISGSPTDTQPVFDAIVRSGLKLFPDAATAIVLRDGDQARAVAIADKDSKREKAWKSRFPVKVDFASIHGSAILDCKMIDIPDAKAHEGGPMAAGVRNFLASGYRAITIMPMVRGNAAIGALSVVRVAPDPLSDKQIELLKTFAAQAVIAIENTRLLNELRESLQQQTATADVLKVISRSTFDLHTVLQTLVESAATLCDADKTIITRQKDGVFYRAESYGFSPEFIDYVRNIPIAADRGSTFGRALLEGRAVHIPDVKADAEYTLLEGQRLGDYRTTLAAPMLREGAVIGVLSLTRSEVRPFTEKQIELASTFADQAAIAIENVRLFESVEARTRELSEALEQQTATSEVLKVISSSPSELEPVFQVILENAIRICEAKFGHVVLLEGNLFRMAVQANMPAKLAEFFRERGPFEATPGSHLDRVARTKQVSHTADDAAEAVQGIAARYGGARSIIAVPMLKDDTLIGAIMIYRQEVRPFSDKQIALVQNFAAQAVIAIENARLLNELRQRTHELATSLDHLRSAQDRLVQTQKLASLGQLTAGIAHEIKNPLNFVNNFSGVSAELIDELQDTLKVLPIDQNARAEINELTNTLRGNLDKVVQHGKRADSIVKNMLLHSREGSGDHRVIDINTLVEESLNLAWHGARAEKQGFDITLERSFDPTAGEIDLFPQDITRALLNLISNGFYAATKRKAETNGGGYVPTLAASTKSLGDRVEIRIRDNGTGIPPEVKEKMFNPFFTTKPAGEGTGLGLSISHDIIVKQHGGSIDVDTQPGEFTEIRVVLPRIAALLPQRS